MGRIIPDIPKLNRRLPLNPNMQPGEEFKLTTISSTKPNIHGLRVRLIRIIQPGERINVYEIKGYYQLPKENADPNYRTFEVPRYVFQIKDWGLTHTFTRGQIDTLHFIKQLGDGLH